MVSLLFWNKNQKCEFDSFSKIMDGYDIIFVAECNFQPKFLKFLKTYNENYRILDSPSGKTNKVSIFTKLSKKNFNIINEDFERLTICSLKTKEIGEVLICTIHFLDKRNNNSHVQALSAHELNRHIILTEKKRSTTKTLIIGDFNMNPFDIGMTGVTCFNAVPSITTAKKIFRIYQNKEYYYFYNPMWNYFGKEDIPGTFHLSSPNDSEIHWNILDQLIFRPCLIDYIDFTNLPNIILNNSDNYSLSTESLFPNKKFSDHFPIQANLGLEPKYE